MIAWRRVARVGVPEVFAAIGLASFAVARYVPVLSFGYRCPFLHATGLPCASCGMTRAFVHLAHGDLAAAFGASPLGAALAAGLWLFTAADLVRAALDLPLPVPSERLARSAARAGLVALLVNWAYLVVREVGS